VVSSSGERVVLLSVLVIVGRTTTPTVPWVTVGALHLDTVPGTGLAMDVQVAPLGLDCWSQLTTKGMYKLPPLPVRDWQSIFTLVIV
jgi:hypothetical protein